MTPERWQQVRDVLEQALELAPGERSSFLDGACSSDPSLRQEVDVLLDSDPKLPSSFLQSSALADELGAYLDGIGFPVGLEARQVFAQRFHLVRKRWRRRHGAGLAG
jgi:hypothetical protein